MRAPRGSCHVATGTGDAGARGGDSAVGPARHRTRPRRGGGEGRSTAVPDPAFNILRRVGYGHGHRSTWIGQDSRGRS
jgi:hypothetical protein